MKTNGKASIMRNSITGALWSVSYDYLQRQYHHQPLGNLAHIRHPFTSDSIKEGLVPAGTREGLH